MSFVLAAGATNLGQITEFDKAAGAVADGRIYGHGGTRGKSAANFF